MPGNRPTAAGTSRRCRGTHGDYHDLWIDPKNPQRIIQGNDGGATVSFNGGASWSTIYNQPTMEFYHVTTDNQVPYRLYGAQQDNSTISVASRSNLAAITQVDTYEVGGGESGYIAVQPDDPNIIFAGQLRRDDHALRSPHRPAAEYRRLAGGDGRLGREGCQIPLPVDLPHPHLAARPE